jgi:hypothetical protein
LKKPVIPCQLQPGTSERINAFADSLRQAAPAIGSHGLSEEEFWESGIFGAAIERLRGQQAASTSKKYGFVADVLATLKTAGEIADYRFAGGGERHDYDVEYADGYRVAIETKGCLDGNNTNIFLRPAGADEFAIWSLCQNPGADPRHNVWSGVHTRLGAEIVHRQTQVDYLIVWDMVCGTVGRPCPKVIVNPARSSKLLSGKEVPPPCIYMFPRTLPDARNNPSPPPWRIADRRFVSTLCNHFLVPDDEVFRVMLSVSMDGPRVMRKTTIMQGASIVVESGLTELKRAR